MRYDNIYLYYNIQFEGYGPKSLLILARKQSENLILKFNLIYMYNIPRYQDYVKNTYTKTGEKNHQNQIYLVIHDVTFKHMTGLLIN